MKKSRLLLISLFSTSVFAQFSPIDGRVPVMTRELLSVWQRHAVLVSGSTDPAGIPYGYAMERVFWQFVSIAELGPQRFRQELRKTIPATDADADRIANIAAESDEVATRVRNATSMRLDAVCSDLVMAEPGTVNAVQLAQRFLELDASEAEQLTSHYREAVARLAPATRLSLEAFVDTNLRPKMTWGHDLVGLANEVPEAFVAHRREVCQRRLEKPAAERTWKHAVLTETVVAPRQPLNE